MGQTLIRFAAFIMVACLSVAGSAQAGGSEDRVIALLAKKTSAVEKQGYGMSHAPYVDKLSGGKDELRLTLQRDVEYTIIGVCDKECGDVDIRLYDENNNLVDEDVSANMTPTVRVNPQWTGRFTVQVEIYRCTRTPCYYAVGILAK